MQHTRRFIVGILAISLLALAGCATSLDAQQKAAIRTVSLEPLEMAPKPMVATPGMGMAALLGGGLGIMLAQNGSDVQTTFKAIVERQVDVPSEIRRATKAEMQRKGYQVVEAGQPADARLTIKANYALGLISLTGDDRAAGTTVNVDLIRTRDGKSIYRKVAMGLNLDAAQRAKLRVAPFAQWFKDDALVAEQFKLVPGFVVIEGLSGL